MSRKIRFVFNNSELGAGTYGASLGPHAIQVAARKSESQFFSEYPIDFVHVENNLIDLPTKFGYAKRIDGVHKVASDLVKKIESALDENSFPFVLAGDHSSAAFTLAGIRKKYPEKRIGVVWIDAHSDLHSPYTTPSGNMHGMPLAIALGLDNLEKQRNSPDQETIQYWNELKNIGGNCPIIYPENLVFIGVRDTEEEEYFLIKKLGIKNFTVDQVHGQGAEKIVKTIFELLSDCDILYISFDVDSMDPDETSYGTGTPVKNGLSVEEARVLLNGFAKSPKTVCMEVVEVNPCLDNKVNTMAEVAFSLIESVAHTLEGK
jgi:arginase